MNHVVRNGLAAVWIAYGGGVLLLQAQSPSNSAVRVSAQVQTNPPSITLSWPGDSRSVIYFSSRKLRDDAAWGDLVELGPSVTSYVDTNVVVGGACEYWISKLTSDTFVKAGEGYIYAGMELPLLESRGKVILVVDNTFTSSLATELGRLQQDLIGDGWTVLRHDVARMAVDPTNTSSSVWAARSNELAGIKALITADYNADPANVKAVFLFGHVPVPYSGDLNPDAHPEHKGAWPADGYYGDMDGNWTDSTVNRTTASDPRNRNVPGDGKLDRTFWPIGGSGRSDLEIQIGRVDLANLPAFGKGEGELLRQYLNKDHNFRHRIITAERRGLIDDNLGYFLGEAPAVNGWRNFAPFFGASNTIASDWLTTLATQSYLWAFGCGAGTYTSCSGVATTTQLATSDPRVVFTMLHGSYFGDWDSQNNLLRAAIATTNYTLTSAWVTRPYWYFHHMGLGETIGFSTHVTQNNDGTLYPANGFQTFVHVALMGDPTLRMHIVAPAANLAVVSNGANVDLIWNASPDSVLGYAVYRAADPAGPYTRLNPNLTTGTNYTVAGNPATNYMVRAVKLEVSGSGSYYNASQGIFQTVSIPSGPPVLTITAQDTNKVYGAPLPEFAAAYSGFVNGDTTNDLTSQATLSTPATAASPAGSYAIAASGASSPNYTIVYIPGTLTVTPAATTGSLTSSPNPALPGQPVSFTLTLSAVAPGVGTPTGNVQFTVDGSNAGAAVSLSGGVASYSSSALGPGNHSVGAEYAGDENFTGTTNLLSPAQLINTPPVAIPDTIERDPTNSVKVSVATLLSNDSDADGDPISFLGVSATSVNGGTVVSNSNWFFYAPAVGWTDTDTFTYTITDGRSPPMVGTVTINVRVNIGPAPNLTITVLGNGSYLVHGDGIPDRTYRILFAEDMDTPNWQSLGPAMADANGIFEIVDTAGSPQRFYRSVYP